MSRDDAKRIEDIREACRKLAKIASTGRDKYDESWVLRDAANYNLSILGDALNNLSDEFVARNPQMPVRQAKSLRNRLQHEYWAADYDILWDTMTKDVQALQSALETTSMRSAT